MTRPLIFALLVAPAIACGPVAARPPGTGEAPAAAQAPSWISVTVPQDDTELVLQGRTVEGFGTVRELEIPPPPPGATRTDTFTATWKPNAYTTMTRSKTVTWRAGARLAVDLTTDDPNDRVRVIYVPTPYDVAERMVDLAAVTEADVVYEPGCGDARITIAAIRAGARRGICIDIERERAEESRANVDAAGMRGRIDVRLGDALDLKDLSDVTVVFLYMGDHFNQLIRPVLWRELPIGARVVSHRFTMGDWNPDRTMTVGSAEGGEWVLHLWTITEQVKRRMRRERRRRPPRLGSRRRIPTEMRRLGASRSPNVRSASRSAAG